MIKNKIARDTLLLTLMQLFLDTSALMLNVFIAKRLGTSATGVLSLTGTFLGLAGMISNGNAFLCTSRLISEELGKPDSDPNRILAHGIKLCIMLSVGTSAVLLIFSEPICDRFFHEPQMLRELRLMPLALISGAIACCFKGYFNACRRSVTPAICDILEFCIKSGIIVILTLSAHNCGRGAVCGILISGIIAGNVFSVLCLSLIFALTHRKFSGRATLTFGQYASLAFPIMGGGLLTSVLGSANDALIPVCLRQYGSTVDDSLSLFGIFEAIVIPTIFFPSVVLCSMSGIVVSESARAVGAGNRERIHSFTSRLIQLTLTYSIFISALLIRFGRPLGTLLGGGREAGGMITFIAPVVPFIYMEIILEALIKGMGMQAFSSLNYLAEYVIRISVVLIFVSRIGFYGIALSYYASNIFGNCMRLAKILRTAGIRFRPFRLIAVPVVYAFMTGCAAELLMRPFSRSGANIPYMLTFAFIWAAAYGIVFMIFSEMRTDRRSQALVFVNNDQ